MFDIEKGDIVAIIKPVFIDFPGGAWSSHFVDKKVYYKAIERSNNSGNFRAVDKLGRLNWINRLDVISINRKDIEL